MRKGAKVILHTNTGHISLEHRGKLIPTGAEGVIVAVRNLPPDQATSFKAAGYSAPLDQDGWLRDAYVKFKGVRNARVVAQSHLSIQETKQ